MGKDKCVSFRDLSNITCYKCGKKGHLKPNCPDNAKTVTWKDMPQKDGEPTTKTSGDKEFYWCGQCRGGASR